MYRPPSQTCKSESSLGGIFETSIEPASTCFDSINFAFASLKFTDLFVFSNAYSQIDVVINYRSTHCLLIFSPTSIAHIYEISILNLRIKSAPRWQNTLKMFDFEKTYSRCIRINQRYGINTQLSISLFFSLVSLRLSSFSSCTNKLETDDLYQTPE